MKRTKVYQIPAEKRHQQTEALKEGAERFIHTTLETFPDVERVHLFDPKVREWRVSRARHVCLALLFHVVMRGKNKRTLAVYVGLSIATVTDALAKVNSALRSPIRADPLKMRILKVCEKLDIEPERLRLRRRPKRK